MESEIKPYQKADFAPKPVWLVRFARKNLIFQFFRFAIINLKMIRLIWKSHK
jgi:hypothetical protein